MWGSILNAIGGIFTGLFGGGSGGSNQTVVSQLADKILPETAKERAAAAIAQEDEDIKDVSSARTYNAPDMPIVQYTVGMGIIPFFMLWMLDVVDRIVDTVNHLIRPGVLVWLIGGFMKRWPLPDPKVVDPQLWTTFMIVITFFFGARTLVTDVPKLIAAFKK